MKDLGVLQGSRLFLVDHMCVLPYGHNLNCLVLFEDALKGHFEASYCLASRDLPSYAEQSVRVRRVLSYPYDGLIDRAPRKQPQQNERKSGHGAVDWSSVSRSVVRTSRRAFYTGLLEGFGYDFVRRRTGSDWRRLLNRFKIGANDVIFFPSAEYYGCLSLLDVVHRLPVTRRPKIHLRLIGVMESAGYAMSPARPEFFASVRRAVRAGINVTLSAETTTYASFVQRLTGIPVTYVPYPLAKEYQPLNWKSAKVIASPGQGRHDKGFFRIFNIVSRLQKIAKNGPFLFDVQNMRRGDTEFRPRYESILKNIPDLELRPARLRQEEIDAIYAGADILMLPYDAEVYALRGSAVYQEGLACGRPVVCSTGTGVSDLVLRYGNGLLATSDNEFAESIDQLAGKTKQEVETMVTAARQTYQRDFDVGVQELLEGLSA